MAMVEGSNIVARSLADQGAEIIFGVVGGPVIEVFGAAPEYGIRCIGVRHEQAAVMSAQAYGYVGGKLGVAVLASGPAVTNGLTGIHTAWDNCWPLIVIGGSSSLRQRGRGAFQEAESVAMARPITKWAVQVDNPRRIPEYIARAVQIATSGRPGPVYLDLPSDVLHESIDEEAARPFPRFVRPAPTLADPAAVERAAELLRSARRPVVLIGKGVRWSEPYAELRQLVEGLSVPFVTSPMGRGFLPDDHPLCFNSARSRALRESDVALVVGARLNWMFNFGRSIGPEAKIIQIDIEPEEIGANRPVDVGLAGDARAVLRQVLDEVARTGGSGARSAETDWLDLLREARAKNEASIEPLLNSDASPLTHHRLLKEVRDAIPRDAIITVDGQIVLATGRQVLNSYVPASRLNSGSNGCMGVGVPFAVGAQLARPNQRVISVNGDCAFGFNALEMETAVRYGLPVIFIIDNNDGIMGGVLEGKMFGEKGHPERVAMYQPGIHYNELMATFGGYSEYVANPAEVGPAIQRALASGRAACINVPVDPRAIWPIPTGGRASSLMGY